MAPESPKIDIGRASFNKGVCLFILIDDKKIESKFWQKKNTAPIPFETSPARHQGLVHAI